MKISKAIQGFLVDMDGTLYLSDALLPGAKTFLSYMENKPMLLLTNNSSKNRFDYAKKLSAMGITINPDKVLTSGQATAHTLYQSVPEAPIAVFGTPELEQEFTQLGFMLTMDNPRYVVLGFDMTLDYAKLTVLCNLVRSGLPYIATHPDFNCPVKGGFIPDIGAIIAFVQASTGRTPETIIGKPHRPILDMAAQRLDLPIESLCMVGDRLYTDIAMGQTAPIHTALVLSGETQAQDLENSPFQPDYVFNTIGDLVGCFERST